jgi:LacI family transcriptional regulator
MATQKDVAQLAGVSFITVSRVVNKEGNVKEATRLRVEEAIRALGYCPSFAGKALNSGRNETIGVMTPDRFGDGMENAYLMGILRGIELACRERGQDILLSPMSSVDPDFDFLRPYRQRKVDGMIYVGLRAMPAEMIREIEERLIPCVVVGDRPEHAELSWVDTDNYAAGYETMRRILARGHRDVAFLGLRDDIHNENITDRERGFLAAMRNATANGAQIAAGWNARVIRTSYDKSDVRRDVRQALESPDERPTALFCATDSMLLAAVTEIREMGLSVPEDISLVGFDGFLADYPFKPTLATNEQPLIAMGRKAAEILFGHVRDHAAPRDTEVFPVRFIDGESLGEHGARA